MPKKTAETPDYTSPEFQQFLRAENLRVGKGVRVITSDVREKYLKRVFDNVGGRQLSLPETNRILKTNLARITKDAELLDKDPRVGQKDLATPTKRPRGYKSDYVSAYSGWSGPLSPEYDMLRPWTIMDTDSYVARAIARKMSLFFRQDFQITGRKESYVSYLQRRLEQISFTMECTTWQFFRDIVFNLIVCSNCFLLKIRNADLSGGLKSERNGNKVPVAAYQILPANNMQPVLDKNGEIEYWRRSFYSGYPPVDYLPNDIIHFAWDVKPGHIFGTPRLTPVEDDIFALRRLEENVEYLTIQHLVPTIHVKVGSKEQPAMHYPNGQTEVDYISDQIRNMPKEGTIVTDERVEIDVLGAEGKALDPKTLLDHYQQRVFTGLGVSPIDMSITDTSNRSTADTVSQNLKDSVRSDQQAFCSMIAVKIFRELFAESPVPIAIQRALSDVALIFPEPDGDNLIKAETHATNLYNNNAITHPEYRRRLGHDPMTPEGEQQTNFKMHTLPLAELKANLGNPAANSAKTKNAPQNQHKTNLAPTKAKSSMELELIGALLIPLFDRLNSAAPGETVDIGDEVAQYFEALRSDLKSTAGYTNQFEGCLNALEAEFARDLVAADDPDVQLMFFAQKRDRLEKLVLPLIGNAQ